MKQDIKSRIEKIKSGMVPEGYLRANSSTIPCTWQERTIGELTDAISQKARTKKLEILSISAGKGFVSQSEKFGKEIAGNQYSQYIVIQKGDFSYNKGNSKTYPQGCIYMLENREIAAVPNVFISFRFGMRNVIPEYYKHLFMSGYLNKQLNRLINSGVRNDGLLNLYDDDFYRCLLPVPSFTQQSRIAEILAHCDKVIKLKKQLIEEKQKQKKWLLQNLLNPYNGFRLKGFVGIWENATCDELFVHIRNGFVGTVTPYYVNNGVIYLQGNNIKNGKILLDEVEHILAQFHETHPKSRLRKDDLVVVQSGHVGECAVIPQELDGSNCHAIIIMTPSSKVNSKFVSYLLNSTIGKQLLLAVITGNTVKHILASDMKQLEISLPNLHEQTVIANVLDCAAREIDLLERDLTKWKLKKKALMQLLLTGIVRV
jgi:type I restriction enzyme S subunit